MQKFDFIHFSRLLATSAILGLAIPATSQQAVAEPPCFTDKCPSGWLKVSDEERQRIFAFAEDYKAFMHRARTELMAVKETIQIAEANGFSELTDTSNLSPGRKYYYSNRERSIVLIVIGKKGIGDGVHVAASHIDSPRLELKGRPLYEREGFAQFQTNFHGGLKTYQWTSIPLALIGRVDKKDGTTVEISIGLDPGEPIFIIPDLSPHVDGDLRDRKQRDAIKHEELDPIIGTIPMDEKEGVSAQVEAYLKSEYGIGLDDLVSAELALVPAFPPRDVGFDRSLMAIYGQDDRLSAYASVRGILATDSPEYTAIAHLVDNEESGNVNNTGASSSDLFDLISGLLYRQMGGDYREPDARRALKKSKVISIDVNPGINPIWPSAWEKGNAPRLGNGINMKLYGRGFNANSEYIAWTRNLLDQAGVPWQTATYKVNGSGGGTVGREYARHNMEVIDFGVPVLSIHTPYAVSSKADVYSLYKATKAFFEAE